MKRVIVFAAASVFLFGTTGEMFAADSPVSAPAIRTQECATSDATYADDDTGECLAKCKRDYPCPDGNADCLKKRKECIEACGSK